MRVVKEREGGVVRRVRLLDEAGEPIAAVTRFLDHLAEREYSPYTLCAYAYDLQNLFIFLAGVQLEWQAFRPADALQFLSFLRRRPSQRSAQRLGLTLIAGGETPGRRLSAALRIGRGDAVWSLRCSFVRTLPWRVWSTVISRSWVGRAVNARSGA